MPTLNPTSKECWKLPSDESHYVSLRCARSTSQHNTTQIVGSSAHTCTRTQFHEPNSVCSQSALSKHVCCKQRGWVAGCAYSQTAPHSELPQFDVKQHRRKHSSVHVSRSQKYHHIPNARNVYAGNTRTHTCTRRDTHMHAHACTVTTCGGSRCDCWLRILTFCTTSRNGPKTQHV